MAGRPNYLRYVLPLGMDSKKNFLVLGDISPHYNPDSASSIDVGVAPLPPRYGSTQGAHCSCAIIGHEPTTSASSWSETFPPKLTGEVVLAMKQKFKQHYPAEILLPETMPSLRLLSLMHHQKSKQAFRWIPWKYRFGQANQMNSQWASHRD